MISILNSQGFGAGKNSQFRDNPLILVLWFQSRDFYQGWLPGQLWAGAVPAVCWASQMGFTEPPDLALWSYFTVVGGTFESHLCVAFLQFTLVLHFKEWENSAYFLMGIFLSNRKLNQVARMYIILWCSIQSFIFWVKEKERLQSIFCFLNFRSFWWMRKRVSLTGSMFFRDWHPLCLFYPSPFGN